MQVRTRLVDVVHHDAAHFADLATHTLYCVRLWIIAEEVHPRLAQRIVRYKQSMGQWQEQMQTANEAAARADADTREASASLSPACRQAANKLEASSSTMHLQRVAELRVVLVSHGRGCAGAIGRLKALLDVLQEREGDAPPQALLQPPTVATGGA